MVVAFADCFEGYLWVLFEEDSDLLGCEEVADSTGAATEIAEEEGEFRELEYSSRAHCLSLAIIYNTMGVDGYWNQS
jgi:hypothetical protein